MVMERRTKRNGKTKKITKKKKQKTAVAHVSNKAAAREGTCFWQVRSLVLQMGLW
jgi:hypothetical protein